MLQLTYQDNLHKWDQKELDFYLKENEKILKQIKTPDKNYKDSLGWLTLDDWANESVILDLEEKAKEVKKRADVFIVVGVGGSNNASRAVIKALEKPGMPKFFYMGTSTSPQNIKKILNQLHGKSVYINVIAKNFETLEPGIGFRILRQFLKKEYGETANERVIITGTKKSWLHQLSKQYNYTFLSFPEDIGGRYSAISSVALFPMAVAGINIRQLVEGATKMRLELTSQVGTSNIAYYYAALRNFLHKNGYQIEMLSSFDPRFQYFNKWWIQLFAESEGKDGKGIYPVAATYSEDLHSIGQFVQEGNPIIFETFLEVKTQDSSYILTPDELDDRFEYLNGIDLWDVNKKALEATIKAHSSQLPCLHFTVNNVDEYSFGQLFYFFEYACYISSKLLDVDPFNQPGVEAYKSYMFDALGKERRS